MIRLPSFFLVLLAFVAIVYFLVFVIAWRRGFRSPARSLSVVLWSMTAAACFASLTPRLPATLSSLATSVHDWGGPISLVVLCGCALSVGKPRWIGRSGTAQLLFLGVAAYFSIQFISGATNGEYPGKISLLEVGYLAYLPTIYWLSADERFTSAELLRIGRQLCMAIVYASLALAVVAPHVAFVGERRLVIGSLHERLAGVTPHPNLLSAVAALGLLLSLHARQGRLRAGCLSLATIGLAESREAAVAILACLVIYWLFAGRVATGRLLLAAPLLLFTGVFLAVVGSEATSPTTSRLATGASSVNSRTHIWDLAIAQFGAKPTLGWGPFAFSDKASTHFSLSQTLFLHAHNQFVEAVVEAGVLGLCAVLAVVGAMVRIAWMARRDPIYPSAICFGLLMMLTEVPLSIHLYGVSFVIVIAWVIAMITVAGARSVIERAPKQRSNEELSEAQRGRIVSSPLVPRPVPARGLQ